MPGILVFMPGDPVFVAATQKTPLYHLALENEGLVFLGPGQACNNQRQFSRLTLPGQSTDSRPQTHSQPEKQDYLLVQGL